MPTASTGPSAHGRKARTAAKTPAARLRIVLGPDVAIGPGKADLLQAIKETGSIAAAGRHMGMSYKRAWFLVSTMNGCFRTPLVDTAKGGSDGGGARLTALGERVLASFRRMEELTAAALHDEIRALARSLRTSTRSPK